MKYCKKHNEPKNVITDIYGRICKDCYTEISKTEQVLKKSAPEQMTTDMELLNEDDICEKCGEELKRKLLRDEWTSYCACGFIKS